MMDFRLIHDGRNWIAENGSVSASAETLEDLDLKLAEILGRLSEYSRVNRLKIRMTFDNSVIPQWIRQYSNHYFNRIVTLNLKVV